MKVVDARSGAELVEGQTVRYPDGEWLRLDKVYEGLFESKAMVTTATRDPGGRLLADTRITRLSVRYLHPAFFLRKVGFLET